MLLEKLCFHHLQLEEIFEDIGNKKSQKNVHLVGGYLDYRPGLQIKIEQIPFGNYYNQLF